MNTFYDKCTKNHYNSVTVTTKNFIETNTVVPVNFCVVSQKEEIKYC